MTRTTLTPCSSCSRHVRRDERACPFCGVALALVASPPMRTVSERLGRAAIFSLGAAAITNVVGCGAKSQLAEPAPFTERDGGHDAGQLMSAYGGPALFDGGGPSTHYGGPPMNDAATGNDAALDEDAGAPLVLYGGPVLAPDAGVDADLGCCSADYGAPPSP